MNTASGLSILAAACGVVFVALYLGGAPVASYDALGLVPLIAGVGAALLRSWRGGHLSGVGVAWSLSGLAFWIGWLFRKSS